MTKTKIFLFLISFMFCSEYCFANKPVILNEISDIIILDSSNFELIDNFPETKVFHNNNKKYPYNKYTNKPCWFKFTLKNINPNVSDWLIVSYNYAINDLTVIEKSENGQIKQYSYSNKMSIYDRQIQHKQPVFPISVTYGETKTIYLKISNETSYQYAFAFYSNTSFMSHFFREYLLYGIFYGLMLFVLVYCLLNFIFLRDKIMLTYAVFIFCQILYMLFRDGNCLFIMPKYTENIDFLKTIFRAGVSISVLSYIVFFLKIKPNSVEYKIISFFAIFRIVCLIIEISYYHSAYLTIDALIIFVCFIISIRENKTVKISYMTIGFLCLFISYLCYLLSLTIFPSLVSIGFFGLYFGIALESIFMTMAMTERFKKIMLDAYTKNIINQELDNLVTERTAIISKQNYKLEETAKELNLFLYSISHDIKGPLKSIRGLCQLGLIDQTIDAKEMYDKIISRVVTLEFNINDINAVVKLKNANIYVTEINFKLFHEEIVKSFLQYPGISDVNIDVQIDVKDVFKADTFILRCIYQNIFENAIKYKNPSLDSYLNIKIVQVDKKIHMEFEDNGLGIREDALPYIFEMFYRANEISNNDTGLGLYIVNLALDKINGSIEVESKIGKGTKFKIIIPFD